MVVGPLPAWRRCSRCASETYRNALSRETILRPERRVPLAVRPWSSRIHAGEGHAHDGWTETDFNGVWSAGRAGLGGFRPGGCGRIRTNRLPTPWPARFDRAGIWRDIGSRSRLARAWSRLSGELETPAQKAEAIARTRYVAGVRGVVDQLRVTNDTAVSTVRISRRRESPMGPAAAHAAGRSMAECDLRQWCRCR